MNVLQRLLLFTLLYGLAIAQDYQDYQENTPRPAPIRLRPNAGLADAPRPTPVPILKQINKHNEDGSYTYGYEGADGSFKIETKLATGEVKGKYGYVDETGKVRVVEYGANQYGFQPSGEGITVAPPTLVDETAKEEPDYEDEPVRPQRPYRPPRPQQPRPAPAPAPRPQPQPQPQPQYFQYEEEVEQEPEPPRRIQYAPQPQQISAGPAPPRIQVPGAQRSTDVLYSPLQRPARPEPDYSQTQNFGGGPSNVRISRPVYAPAPVQPAPASARANNFLGPPSGGRPILDQFGPAPQTRPVQQAAPAPLPRYQPQINHQPQAQGRAGGGGGSLLDQLARDYALPQGNAQPLHDISFGYY
ncbi:pollen-specific leucine-rich repeat extensin-like protein 1 [Rhagoletis pomonella]|uniref:pollen-specific leucine-rich repeat extensin-like protein 1 n=1 Tax=Rhagoletis pomonella TaxID=28610 RepID=UPI001785732F|nr:pollen-specific leucine-rich repeat extensin-like protein 1 [Rhagoletis pomonella]